MSLTRSRTCSSISRDEAARLLRAARRAAAGDIESAGEMIGWALTALRDNRHARRLKIDYLLHCGNFESADALIARSLMHGCDHALLRLRFARSQFMQGRLDHADR